MTAVLIARKGKGIEIKRKCVTLGQVEETERGGTAGLRLGWAGLIAFGRWRLAWIAIDHYHRRAATREA